MSTLKEIIGHQENINTLLKAVQFGKVAHAYLFVGTDGVGKNTTARAFAKGLLCEQPLAGQSCNHCKSCHQFNSDNHPDFYTVVPSGVTIKLEQIHQMQKSVGYRSYQGGRQVYIIEQCDVMTLEAANALLKTLEEPQGNTVFILTSSRPYAVLPTILSRCQQFWFKPMAVAEIVAGLERYTDVSPEQKQMLAIMAGGSLGRALQLSTADMHTSRRQVLTLLEMVQRGGLVELLQQGAELATERSAVLDWVELLQLWLRDLLVWHLTEDQSLLINIDLTTELTNTTQYSVEQLLGMLEETERARMRLEAKGNVRLVVEVLLLQLAQLAGNKGG